MINLCDVSERSLFKVTLQGRPGNCVFFTGATKVKPVLHGIGTLLKEGVTYSFRISSSVVSLLYYAHWEWGKPVRQCTARRTHTEQVASCIVCADAKTYKFSTSPSVQWQQHIVMLLIAAQVVRRVNWTQVDSDVGVSINGVLTLPAAAAVG